MTMRTGLVAFASVLALAVSAPGAFAATQPKQDAPAAQEAPAEPYLEGQRERASDTGVCAPRVAYRGHRRVNLPLRECRPLFAPR